MFKRKKETSVRIVLPEPHYTLFNTQRSGQPEVICVNDALLAFEHAQVFPWHLEVTIHARELGENGMPTPEESEALTALGDRIETLIEGRNALFLARSTWNGLRQLLFQVHDPEIADAALRTLLDSGPQPRPWEYRMHADPEWTEAGHVFKLFPLASGHDA